MDNLKILFLILAVIAMLFGIYQSIEVYILKRKRKKRIKEFDQLLLKQIDSFKAYQLSYTELEPTKNSKTNKKLIKIRNSLFLLWLITTIMVIIKIIINF